MIEIVLPNKPGLAPIDYYGPPPVPASMRGRISAVCRSVAECAELPKFYGSRDWCPRLPVLLLVPGHATPIHVAGLGETTAAELADLSVVTWERAIARLIKYGPEGFDFDTMRERIGAPRREDREQLMSEAIWRRRQKHIANFRTDPAKVIQV